MQPTRNQPPYEITHDIEGRLMDKKQRKQIGRGATLGDRFRTGTSESVVSVKRNLLLLTCTSTRGDPAIRFQRLRYTTSDNIRLPILSGLMVAVTLRRIINASNPRSIDGMDHPNLISYVGSRRSRHPFWALNVNWSAHRQLAIILFGRKRVRAGPMTSRVKAYTQTNYASHLIDHMLQLLDTYFVHSR